MPVQLTRTKNAGGSFTLQSYFWDRRLVALLGLRRVEERVRGFLELLAQEAGMSRTAFATKFHATMRRPPGKYLAGIRLALAQRAVDQGKGLKEAARAAGYANSSALSRALTRSRWRSRHG